jgi:hypothetical protein
MVPRLEQRLLHEIVGAFLVAAQRYGEGAQISHLCDEGVFQARRHFVLHLLISASLEILEEAQQVIGNGFARDLVEHGPNVSADMGLQIGRQSGLRFGESRIVSGSAMIGGSAGLDGLVHLLTCAWHV